MSEATVEDIEAMLSASDSRAARGNSRNGDSLGALRRYSSKLRCTGEDNNDVDEDSEENLAAIIAAAAEDCASEDCDDSVSDGDNVSDMGADIGARVDISS
eukprot:951283-Prorocentrum_minimum.AAC.1